MIQNSELGPGTGGGYKKNVGDGMCEVLMCGVAVHNAWRVVCLAYKVNNLLNVICQSKEKFAAPLSAGTLEQLVKNSPCV